MWDNPSGAEDFELWDSEGIITNKRLDSSPLEEGGISTPSINILITFALDKL